MGAVVMSDADNIYYISINVLNIKRQTRHNYIGTTFYTIRDPSCNPYGAIVKPLLSPHANETLNIFDYK